MFLHRGTLSSSKKKKKKKKWKVKSKERLQSVSRAQVASTKLRRKADVYARVYVYI
jgi:hypothetical protein